MVLAIVSALVAFVVWVFQRELERRQSQRLRRERLYEALLESITELSSFGNAAPFLVESQMAWLYAPDAVLKAINGYLENLLSEHVPAGSATTVEQRKARQRLEGVIRIAIRRDLGVRTALDENWIETQWRPAASNEKAIRDYFARRNRSSNR
jgi:hypothetical protein